MMAPTRIAPKTTVTTMITIMLLLFDDEEHPLSSIENIETNLFPEVSPDAEIDSHPSKSTVIGGIDAVSFPCGHVENENNSCCD